MPIKINSEILRKYILIDNKGIQFGIQANNVVEERTKDFICITFWEGKTIIGRFYNYSSLVCLDEKPINTKIH